MLGDGPQALNGEIYHKFTAQQFARQATKLDNGIQIMATTTGQLEQFPGAYSGKVRQQLGTKNSTGGESTRRPARLQSRCGAQGSSSGDDHGYGSHGAGRGAAAVRQVLHRRAGGQPHHSAQAFFVTELPSEC